MSQKNNEDFSMFNTLDVQVKDLARKSYRAIPLNLWIYLEGDSLPHELCNISISGLCFKLNSPEELEQLDVGKCFQIHIFSEIHDDILTLEVQVVRTTEDTCSCFFPNIATKEEKFLDKLILEMQKQVITQRKLAHKKELEREKMQVQELRRLQQLNKMRLEEIHSKTKTMPINPLLDGEQAPLSELAKHINTDFQLNDKNTNSRSPVDNSVTKKMNDFTLFEDINIITDAQNRKTYRTNPTNLWVYVKGILRPHKILNLSTSGICFKYKPTQVILTKDDKIEIEIFCNIREKILTTPAKVVRIDDGTCSCMLPSLAGDNMVLLSKLVAEMKKVEISADSVEELRALMIAFETQEMADRKKQLDFLANEEMRIRESKARLLAIVEEESRIRHEKFSQKHRQVQEYIEQNKSKLPLQKSENTNSTDNTDNIDSTDNTLINNAISQDEQDSHLQEHVDKHVQDTENLPPYLEKSHTQTLMHTEHALDTEQTSLGHTSQAKQELSAPSQEQTQEMKQKNNSNLQTGQMRHSEQKIQSADTNFKAQAGKPQIRIQTNAQKQIIITNNTLKNVNSLNKPQAQVSQLSQLSQENKKLDTQK